MKSIIWKIELAAAVLLAVSALVWGLRPGVWNYGGFYRMAAGEQGRTYTRPGCSTVEVTEDNRLRIQSPAGQTAEFTLSLAENGSYRAAEMAMDGVVRNITYNTATGTFMTAGDSWSISTLVQEKAGFSPGLTDNALYSMALGNHQTRIAGRPGEFLTAGLFLLLGLVLPLLLKPAIALDKFLLGFFYCRNYFVYFFCTEKAVFTTVRIKSCYSNFRIFYSKFFTSLISYFNNIIYSFFFTSVTSLS